MKKIILPFLLVFFIIISNSVYSWDEKAPLKTLRINEQMTETDKANFENDEETETSSDYSDPVFKLSYKKLFIKDRLDIDYFGFRLDAHANDWLSFYWSFYLGENSVDGTLYSHIPLGFYAFALAASSNSNGGDQDELLLLLLLPEGFAFHIKPVSWLELSPFIGFGVDVSSEHKLNTQSNLLLYGLETGLRLNLTPQIGSSSMNLGAFFNYFRDLSEYNGIKRNGYNFGIHFGIEL